MSLFNYIPENLFSILCSKNKETYVNALFVLRDIFKTALFIDKDTLIYELISNLEDQILALEYDDEEKLLETNLSAKAHFLYRKILSSNWIYYEVRDFTEYVSLHDYSIKILDTLYDIKENKTPEYKRFVYDTYSILKQSDNERNEYIYLSLLSAHENSHKLMDSLKSLLNNIQKYYQSVLLKDDVRQILKEHFDEFKNLIADKIIHPIKTLDSLPRFKVPILRILNSWLINPEIQELLIDSAIKESSFDNREDAENKITNMIIDTIDIFENSVEELLRVIDRKNTEYIRAAKERTQYIINADKSAKGKLIEILKKAKDSDEAYLKLESAIEISSQGYIDDYSLYKDKNRRKKGEFRKLEIDTALTPQDITKELQYIEKQYKQGITKEKVFSYVKGLLKDKKEVSINEITISNTNEFILLMLTVIRSNDYNSFYTVELEDSATNNNGYRVPKMTIKHKEKKDVV